MFTRRSAPRPPERDLKRFYRHLRPKFRPVANLFKCGRCGRAYKSRKARCGPCMRVTWKSVRRALPIPKFDIVDDGTGGRIRCHNCSHITKLQARLHIMSTCTACHDRLCVTQPAMRRVAARDNDFRMEVFPTDDSLPMVILGWKNPKSSPPPVGVEGTAKPGGGAMTVRPSEID